jgi:hypothetical protein
MGRKKKMITQKNLKTASSKETMTEYKLTRIQCPKCSSELYTDNSNKGKFCLVCGYIEKLGSP